MGGSVIGGSTVVQKIPNTFLPQCITANYTLVCTIANTALHIIYKCVREYMVSDYRWLTLYVRYWLLAGRTTPIVTVVA